MFSKKLLTLLLLISLITPSLYLPYKAKKAEAFIPVVDVKAIIERVSQHIAMAIAQQMIDRMVASTVKWAQSGFEGNPAYVTNPKQYFTDIADGTAGDFIKGTDLGFLCSPFQANIRLSLAQNYYEPNPFQCTITGIGGNIADFYNDFSKGGWDTWFSMTQNPTNNPYGAYLSAKIELDSRIASALNIEQKQLDWSQGFRGWKACIMEDPLTKKCLARSPEEETPGSIIKDRLDKSLSAPLQKLITAQHIDQLLSGFTSGLLQKFVFGPDGFFSRKNQIGSGSTTQGGRDIDGDGVTDGFDVDGDGNVDVCNFGGANGGSNPPCLGSVAYGSETGEPGPLDPNNPDNPNVPPPTDSTPPAAGSWSNDQWKSQLDSIFASKGIGGTWSYEALSATRADLNALGADWQFTSSGALKPRLYLPTPNGGPLTGDFSRVVDVTDSNVSPGTPWRWIVR